MLFIIPLVIGCIEGHPKGTSARVSSTHESKVVDSKETMALVSLPIAFPAGESPLGLPSHVINNVQNNVQQQLRCDTQVTPAAAWIPFGEQSDRGTEGFPTVQFEALPAPQLPAPVQLEIPLQSQLSSTDSIQAHGPLITLSVRDAPLHSVLSLIANQQGLSIVAASDLSMPVSVTLQPMPLESALDALMAISGCTWSRVNEVIYVTEVKKDSPENFLAQGRVFRVFTLNYLAASDLEKVVTGLLSPVGKVFTKQTDVKDKRKATEQLVVEDLQAYADRVASYIAQVDQPPQQVVVEVRMLQVKLEDDTRHGINFDKVAKLSGADVKVSTQSLATGVGQAAMFTVDGSSFNTLLDCLSTTNDTKTLAAPKLLMINGQESKIQIGRRLGYFVTTTTNNIPHFVVV